MMSFAIQLFVGVLLSTLCILTAAAPGHEVKLEKPVIEQYPSAVLYGQVCSGTIISPTWILTAAHCTLLTPGIVVRAGTGNLTNNEGVVRQVKRLVVHPRFAAGPFWLNTTEFDIKQISARWDFLLVELEKPLPLDGKTMAAARLDDRTSVPAGEKVAMAGFGTRKYGMTPSIEMHVTELVILSNGDCSSLPQFDPQDMICTVGRPPRFDTSCFGDNGGGLINNGKIIGVMSWAEDDATSCRSGAKNIFGRVSAVRDWIKKVTTI